MKTAIIIGSGMAGLTSAILLSMHGYRVTVHEQHFRPGGLLHRFFRQGAAYDTGFHYCGGIAHRDIFGRALRHLGVFDKLPFQPLDPDGFDRLVFPEFEFRVPVGLDRYRDRLVETFPHERAGIDAVIADMRAAIDQYGLYVYKTDVNPVEFLRWEGVSLAEVLRRHVRDPDLIAVLAGQGVLYGVPPEDAPFGLHSVVMDHFLRGAYRIGGGGDRLAREMVSRLKELGGTLRLRSRVTGILVEKRTARGVRLESGEEQRADLVICNAHPRLVLDLLPEDAVRPAYRNRVLEQQVGLAHLGAYLALSGPAPSIGNANIYRYYTLDSADAFCGISPDYTPFYFATAPGEAPVDKDAPQTRRHNVVLLLTSLPWEAVSRWAGTPTGQRPPEYTELKETLLRRLVASLVADHPDLADRIERVEGSTPLTTQHYTTSPFGAMYGHFHSVAQMGLYRPSQAIRVRGCIQVGQGSFTPGVLGATMSAYYGCGFILGLETLVKELKQA